MTRISKYVRETERTIQLTMVRGIDGDFISDGRFTIVDLPGNADWFFFLGIF
jgi:hypothetical protein